MIAPFEPGRSAVLRDVSASDTQNLIWGVVGEFRPSVTRNLKLPALAAGFEIDPLLFARQTGDDSYVPLPRFPKVTQDMTLKVPAELKYQELYEFVWDELAKARPEQTLPSLEPVSIFQKDDDAAHKQVTFRYEIASYERTLTDQEVNKLLDGAAEAAKTKFGAERV
jgi:phenylalanyl-tRNA synthetase beta subunit